MKRLLFVVMVLVMCGTAYGFQAAVSVPNGTGTQVRTNMNNALQAVSTMQAGTSAPSTTYAYQVWLDTSTTPRTLKVRNGANSAWISIGTLDEAGTVFNITGNADLLDNQHGAYYQPASTAITTGNIGSQSVNYATTAGNITGGTTGFLTATDASSKIVYGSGSLANTSNTAINLGNTVRIAVCGAKGNYAAVGIGCTWATNTLTIYNNSDGAQSYTYIAVIAR